MATMGGALFARLNRAYPERRARGRLLHANPRSPNKPSLPFTYGRQKKIEIEPMDKYKVLRITDGQLIELAEFDNEADAVDLADRAKYMRPFVYRHDGKREFATLAINGILEHSIRIVGSHRAR